MKLRVRTIVTRKRTKNIFGIGKDVLVRKRNCIEHFNASTKKWELLPRIEEVVYE